MDHDPALYVYMFYDGVPIEDFIMRGEHFAVIIAKNKATTHTLRHTCMAEGYDQSLIILTHGGKQIEYVYDLYEKKLFDLTDRFDRLE